MLYLHIVLVLSEEEFPKKEKELPENLTLFIENELIEILWIYKNYKSIKKILFTMNKYRNVPIISADDDCIYKCNYAEILYKQVLERYMYDERYRELADAYSAMKPAKAAAALYEMTGNLDVVVAVLQNMDTEDRAAILNALSDVDAVFCAKITVMLAP